MVRLTSAKSEELNRALEEIDIRAHEAMSPALRNQPASAKNLDRSLVVRAPEVHDPTARVCLEIQLPAPREDPPRWRGLEAYRGAPPIGRDVPIRTRAEGLEALVVEATPDLRLPASVEALDRGLGPRLPWRSEDGRDAERQAEAGHAANAVLELVGSLEPGVVVELGILGQADFAPVLNETLHDGDRADRRSRPRSHETTVKRDRVQHFDIGAAFDDETLDDIEAIQLGGSTDHLGQVPTTWRSGTPHAQSSVERATTLENAPDCRPRGERVGAANFELLPNGVRPKLAKVAGLSEFSTNRQHEFLDVRRHPVGRGVSCEATIGPVDPIEPPPHRSLNPVLDRGTRHAEVTSDTSNGDATSHAIDHLATAVCSEEFLVIFAVSRAVSGASYGRIGWPKSTGTQVAEIN